jgi:MFS family permease
MYGLLTLGLNFSTAFVVATLIPIHVMEMVGSRNKEAAMTVVAVIGAILPSFAGILTGYLSDHKLLLNFHNRYGKRKPFIMAGVLMWVVSIMLRSFVYFRGIGTPQNQFLFVVYNLVTTIGFMGLSIAWVPYNALMQDVFPKRRFGVVSGISGFLGFIGNSLGLGLIGLIFNYVPTIILCSVASIVVTVTMIAVLIFVPEKHVEAPEPEHTETKTTVREKIKSVLHVLKEFFTPFKDWDFAWIFIARFVILFTLLGMQNYFLYYMQDVVGPRYQFIIWDKLIKNASEAQAVFLGIVVFSSMISSVVGGALSDRVGRKYVVCGAGLIAALALLAIIPAGSNFNLMCIIAIFLGVACGYVSHLYLLII